ADQRGAHAGGIQARQRDQSDRVPTVIIKDAERVTLAAAAEGVVSLRVHLPQIIRRRAFEARYRRGGGGIQTRQPFALNDSVDRPRPEGDAFRFQERYQLVAAPPILGPQRDEAVGDRRTCPLWTPHWPPRPVRQRANRVRGVVPPAPFVARFSADAEGSTHRRHLR